MENRIFDYIFIWPDGPSQDGITSATTWVQPNGAYHLLARSSCFSDPWARTSIGVAFQLGQYNPQSGSVVYSQNITQTIFSESVREPHGGLVITYDPVPYRDEVTLDIPQYPLVHDYPVVCIISVIPYIAAGSGGEALLDFMGSSYRLNVPSVWLVTDFL